ncbi:hypothetical protein JXA63_02255 [Candidatus Woesebacteria bacterium]|nr:hypothetical protein [Candidatus Woesebacteria bacterium]
MTSKLTLSVNKNVIEDAKKYLQDQSLSKLVEEYFKVLVKSKKSGLKNSIVDELTGVAKLPKGKSPEDVIVDYLLEEYR